MSKLRGAGDRFGDYDRIVPLVDEMNLQTQHSPDLLPKSQSIIMSDLTLADCRTAVGRRLPSFARRHRRRRRRRQLAHSLFW